jgi:hypothetical protein
MQREIDVAPQAELLERALRPRFRRPGGTTSAGSTSPRSARASAPATALRR